MVVDGCVLWNPIGIIFQPCAQKCGDRDGEAGLAFCSQLFSLVSSASTRVTASVRDAIVEHGADVPEQTGLGTVGLREASTNAPTTRADGLSASMQLP